MTARQLRARVDRLAPPATYQIGHDRRRDRRRRDDLISRKLWPGALIPAEEEELAALQALLQDEHRDHTRLIELVLKRFSADHLGHEPLSDDEARELCELERRFPPYYFVDDVLADRIKDAVEGWSRAVE
jgi:hypothetical protein